MSRKNRNTGDPKPRIPRRQDRKEDTKSVYEPINEAQVKALNTIEKSHITFLLGPAGTAKTHTATAYAILAARNELYEKVIFTRPVVEASESLGFLPGSVDEKIAPYMQPLHRCAEKVGRHAIKIESMPLAYLRGITFENSITILDEAQNCTRSQLKLYLTRFGKNCKMIICGDALQPDIRFSGLVQVAEDLKRIDGISVFYFRPEDTVRHPLVEKIATRLKD
jgi:phosphate starvation-inducible PhoH-like protein